MKKDINFWKKVLEKQSLGQVKLRLRDTLESIKFLESIYMTGGANHWYS